MLHGAGVDGDQQRGSRPLKNEALSGAGTAVVPLSTQSGPDASAQSVGRVARLSRNVRQPNHVLANSIAGHKAERRPRAGEKWLAATKHDRVEVEPILVNKTEFG